MKVLKKTVFFISIIFLLFGCSDITNSYHLDSELSSTTNYNVKALYPNGIPESEAVNINIAIGHVEDKFKAIDTENIKYWIENIEFINDRIYYIFRRFEDKPENIVTLGYYAVDVFTGEVFDTKVLTDLIKLD